MALNASGPISIGGATVGQSINLELNKAATAQSSLGQVDFRTLAGVPSGAISLSHFHGKSSELYAFTTHTFTNCGVTGRAGPTLAQMKTAYSAQSWAQDAAFFSLGAYQGYQKWTVPVDGTYRINAYGAAGGRATGYSDYRGRGARIQADIDLVQGEYITIAVGQAGGDASISGGGGGGTFVIRGANTPLVVAGGGAGQYASGDYRTSHSDASVTTTSKNSSGSTTTNGGAGGGGLNASGQSGYGCGGGNDERGKFFHGGTSLGVVGGRPWPSRAQYACCG